MPKTDAPAKLPTLSREQFTKPMARRFATIDLPTMGGSITIRSLTDGERSAFELSGEGDTAAERLADIKRRLIVAASHEPKLEPADVVAMADQDSAVVDYCFERIKTHVGIGDDDVAALVEKPNAG